MAREIVLDTETTGFDPRTGDRLVELAALEIESFVPTGRSFHVYIDPCRDMPAEAEKVHGLSSAFLRGKPRFEHPEVVDAFLELQLEKSDRTQPASSPVARLNPAPV